MGKWLILVLLGLALGLGQPAVAEEGGEAHKEQAKPAKPKKGEEPHGKNEVIAKVPPAYLPLNKMHLVIEENDTGIARSLEVEAWLQPADEEQLALARTNKKQIMAALADEFKNYNWEAFKDSKRGMEVAKAIVKETVHRVSGARIDDVVMKSLVLK